jgi:hypothetical protein
MVRSGGKPLVEAMEWPIDHRSFLVSETGAQLLLWPDRGDPAADGLECAAEGLCNYTAHGRRVAIVTSETELPAATDTHIVSKTVAARG